MAFIDFIEEIFTMKDVNDNKLAFLSNKLCQDPLENFFGCQRQRGGTSDNPTLHEFYNNTQALRVVDSFCRGPIKGNCRGVKSTGISQFDSSPLPKRP